MLATRLMSFAAGLTVSAAVLLVATVPRSAQAQVQVWPGKQPVTLLVPFPPGGSTDLIARTLAPKLQEALGGSFIVQNQAGAGGTVGTAAVKRAAPDGSTILVTSLGPLVIGPHLLKAVGYDALKDLDYITVAVQAPNVLCVPAASRLKTLSDVLAHLKAEPGKMSFASSGNGSSDHLTAELFWQVTGTSGLHIPYKGGGPAISDLMGGQVESAFININTALPQIKAGKLRAVAVSSSKRSPLLAEVPTMDELGVKGADVQSWQAFAGPKGLPADIKNKLRDAVVAGMADPVIKAKLLELGFEIVGNTPEQFSAFQASEFARWKKVIELGKITAD